MGSLYDNSGEDIYARRDIEKRRKHAMAMKKKRKRLSALVLTVLSAITVSLAMEQAYTLVKILITRALCASALVSTIALSNSASFAREKAKFEN